METHRHKQIHARTWRMHQPNRVDVLLNYEHYTTFAGAATLKEGSGSY